MQRTTPTRERRETTAEEHGQPRSGLGFDSLYLLAGAWLLGGLYFDGWSHNHHPELETFFTPWHAVLYSGYAAVVAVLAGKIIRTHATGRPWRNSVPQGYGPSVLGVAAYALGTVGDLLWHETFGIESSVEALVSPTHLALGAGLVLLLIGPFRAAWQRTQAPRGLALVPMVLSLAYVLSVFSFFTLYAHPIARPWALEGNRPAEAVFPLVAPDPDLAINPPGGIRGVDAAQIIGLTSVLLQAGFLMGVVLLAVRRWPRALPAGAFTLIFTLNAALMGVMRDELRLVPFAFLAGLAADGLLKWLRPSVARLIAWRTFAFAVPAIYFAFYFAALELAGGIWWVVHLWPGAIALAGTIGWALSYLVAPPPATSSYEQDGGGTREQATRRHT